jgi:hypothetical protein
VRRPRLWFDGEPDLVRRMSEVLRRPLDGDQQVVRPRVIYDKPATTIEKARMGMRRRLQSAVAKSHLRSA